MRRLLSVIALAAALSIPFALPAQAAEREFSLRYSQNGWANVEQAGNVVLKCPAADPRCAGTQTGTGTQNNNVFAMQYVDVDSDPSTFNSSIARVAVPPGATIDIALLYWGGDTAQTTSGSPRCSQIGTTAILPPDPDAADDVMVKVGAGAAYVPTTAATFDFVVSTGGKPFQGRADITPLFDSVQRPAALTPVDITVANIQTGQGMNCSGGWTVVLVYVYPSGPDPKVSPNPTYAPAFRNVSIFDGFVGIGTASPPKTITLSGFLTAATGSVDAQIGAVAYEGDRGTTQDSLAINGTDLPPADNFFNSTVAGSSYAVPIAGVGQVNPVYNNNLGYDAKTAAVPAGVIPNGSTSVTATFDTNGDAYQPGAFIFTARIQPMADLTKTVSRGGVDINHGNVSAGERLTFTVKATNIGDLAWTSGSISDVVPDGLTPVSGSLTLDGVPQTDAADGDAGQLAGNTYTVNVGALAPLAGRTITFDVTVDKDAPDSVTIVNRAVLDFTIGRNAFTRSAQADVVPKWIDLALTKAVVPTTVEIPGEVTYTITLTSQNAITATGVEVTDGLPAGITVLQSTPSQGSYSAGTWTVGTLAGNATATLTLRARVDQANPLKNVAEISAADQNDLDSEPGNGEEGEDDQADATVTGRNRTTLTTTASAGVPLGGQVSDNATIAGGSNPTGTVTFALFGPEDGTCTGTPVFTSTVPVSGAEATSASFTPAAAGTYRWVATYSGDATNTPSTSPCNTPNETVVIAVPALITVDKTAAPPTLPAPGGTFTFTVKVTNTSSGDVKLVELTDDVYGELNGKGTCAIGTTITAGNSYTCTFPGDFTGAAGASQTDTVTAVAEDARGNKGKPATDDATVSLTPTPPTPTLPTLPTTSNHAKMLTATGLTLLGVGWLLITLARARSTRPGRRAA